jgi:serine/threonine protein phosphatase PrpC
MSPNSRRLIHYAGMDFARSNQTMSMQHGWATHAGLTRSHNEDAVCVAVLATPAPCQLHEPLLLAVADGMGGEEAGEVASRIAIETLRAETQRLYDEGCVPDEGRIPDIVACINDAIADEAQRRGHAMGTTLVFALLHEGRAFLANVGDSRIYLWRRNEDKLVRLVKDHSLVQSFVDHGYIADHERYSHPHRNLITRSLGDSNTGVSDDNPVLKLQHGDWLLLCSDGLWEMVRDEAMLLVLRRAPNPQRACDELITQANRNGGEDNITAAIVHIL